MIFFKPHQTRSTSSSSQFFKNINSIIDWKPIEKYLVDNYKPENKQRGQKAYNPMILFKMQLISVWYGLSDEKTEDLTKDHISFSQFCGLELEDSVPDHSTLSRFRSELTRKKLYHPIMLKVNKQLSEKGLKIEGIAIINASLTSSPCSSKMGLDVIKKITESCHINFLIGSGASKPFLGTLGKVESLLNDLANRDDSDLKIVLDASIKKYYYDLSIKGNIEIRSGNKGKDLTETKINYNDFIQSINTILIKRGSSLIAKQINLFTTNMDLFLEYTLENNKLAFNDGFTGRLNPEFGTENYNNVINKTSVHYEYQSEIPTFNLFKLHGSVNWKYDKKAIVYDYGLSVLKSINKVEINQNDFLKIEDKGENLFDCKTIEELAQKWSKKKNKSHQEFINAYNNLVMINPTNEKFKITTVDYTFYELLRMYSNYLERENSVLFVFGFSFADEHIREITKRAAKSNPTLTIIIFAFSKEDKDSISTLLPNLLNIKFIYDEDDIINFSLDVINEQYFKKIAQSLKEEND